jgi:hypothetical protein
MNNPAGERLSIKSEPGFQGAKARCSQSQLPLLFYVLNAFEIILSILGGFAFGPVTALGEGPVPRDIPSAAVRFCRVAGHWTNL